MKAILLLQDGTIFEGTSFGAKGIRPGEVVFNTAMTGYQEILTDPSYNEQIITMTYPLIGNYGTTGEDVESRKLFISGFIVKENCQYPSNWRSETSLSDYLKAGNIVGLEGIDTRKLVKHIREKGAMKGIISSTEFDIDVLTEKLDKYPGLVGRDIVQAVTVDKPYKWNEPVIDILTERTLDFDERNRIKGSGKIKNRFEIMLIDPPKFNVVAMDFGIKQNILRMLVSHGCSVTVVPANTTAGRILAKKPDGVFLSNGPGDPAAVTYAIETVKNLLGKVPIFGICLGHQILALALGGRTYKLKFGHRGANHPVKNLDTSAIEITSQNHGFCVDIDSLEDKDIELTHINLNDNTLEGLRAKKLKAFSVQYHPEASPGPHDSNYLFKNFLKII